MNGRNQPWRAIAARVLQGVENGQSLSQSLPPALTQVAPEQRPQLQAVCYGSCRWYHRLDAELRDRLSKPLRKPDRIIHQLMLVALFQLRYSEQPSYAVLNETVEACRALDKPHLTGLVNGVLRAAEREGQPEPADDPTRFSHPSWMVEKLRHNWPDDWQAILAANNAQAPMTLRVNARRFRRDDYLAQLQDAGIEATATRFAPHGIQLASPLPVDRLPWFADGAVSVQDEAAQLCTTLLDLAPGQRVLDACAAPGGKTCAILEACDDLQEVVAIDESADRLPRVRENLDRLDLTATLKQADAAATDQWWDGTPFDRILLDVPCSASGVIRRHPDIKLLRRESDIVPLAAIQLGLLAAMWRILQPGGRLVYATCSVFPQENHRIIQRFLKQQTGAVLVSPEVPWGRDMGAGRQLLPDPVSHDGFFYAVLEKDHS
ncbi:MULTISPECIES: 16S rRNA (cytosine(967)-C(5))-methyltransferase RsmB [Marinobacter]|uniref:16S rRNA (cytosine(967)-C(5))-methyltransferase n=1 Tax=Marinobacter profundi TaxID=2666256 RepID=A0A2G1UL32_9GAMM|nr:MULTISPECIES: 16S rRNA (cytosine(967)-C(5))-methyltransferase RsmB [Marinobacter]MBD3658580.1 16S rRNA (cytosine(967)-C(5))-methyltransferase RsmB [Marinobacter sp.]PHQ15197.1 16S rRNA (cytosine(967)-C(5))-methyltransferase [Marinobacter profundi]